MTAICKGCKQEFDPYWYDINLPLEYCENCYNDEAEAEEGARVYADERSDLDQNNRFEFSEKFDWSKWDFDNDPDWR